MRVQVMEYVTRQPNGDRDPQRHSCSLFQVALIVPDEDGKEVEAPGAMTFDQFDSWHGSIKQYAPVFKKAMNHAQKLAEFWKCEIFLTRIKSGDPTVTQGPIKGGDPRVTTKVVAGEHTVTMEPVQKGPIAKEPVPKYEEWVLDVITREEYHDLCHEHGFEPLPLPEHPDYKGQDMVQVLRHKPLQPVKDDDTLPGALPEETERTFPLDFPARPPAEQETLDAYRRTLPKKLMKYAKKIDKYLKGVGVTYPRGTEMVQTYLDGTSYYMDVEMAVKDWGTTRGGSLK